MAKILKKLLLFFLIIISTALLSSCNKKPEKKIIKFSSWGSKTETAVLKELIRSFEQENPDTNIEFIHIPKNYFQKLHLLVASNLTPDVVFVNNLNLHMYAANGVFLNLEKFFKEDSEFSKELFYKQGLNSLSYSNKLYAVPRDVSNLVIYYNKDIFDRYKIPYPDKNWTYSDFLQTAKLLTKNLDHNEKTDLYGISFREEPLFWLPYLWSNGGGFLSENSDKIIINKPESIKSLQFYADLRNKYKVAPSESEAGSATMAQLFMQERIAMHLSGRWFVPVYRANNKFRWDIINFPHGKNGSIVGCDSSGWAISSTSKHPQTAWKFIKFLSSKKSIEELTKSGLIVPARADVANSGIFLNKNLPPESSEIFLDAISTSIPTPVVENYQELLDILNENIEPLWSGSRSANEVINKKLLQKLNNNFKR